MGLIVIVVLILNVLLQMIGACSNWGEWLFLNLKA